MKLSLISLALFVAPPSFWETGGQSAKTKAETETRTRLGPWMVMAFSPLALPSRSSMAALRTPTASTSTRVVKIRICSRSTSRSKPSSGSSSSSSLHLADEIRDYRKGLSQIHKKDYDYKNDNKNDNEAKDRSISTPPFEYPVDCVFKFGGSSLATAERIDHVAKLIRDQIKSGYRPRAVVCSAMGKTTNNLLSAGEFALGAYACGVCPNCTLLFYGDDNNDIYINSDSDRLHAIYDRKPTKPNPIRTS